jgi:hypothetical protein
MLASRISAKPPVREAAAMEQELAYRESNGIAVTLYWHSGTDRLSVVVHDWQNGDWFELKARAENAMDVFEHPYAYAASVAGPVPVAA